MYGDKATLTMTLEWRREKGHLQAEFGSPAQWYLLIFHQPELYKWSAHLKGDWECSTFS